MWIRPDVRNATLRLLENENEGEVRERDQRAAEWYAQQDLRDETNAAELVYHRLRSGDIERAAAAWNDACVPLLDKTEEDLWPDDKKGREWIRERLKQANNNANKLINWEKDAFERIRNKQRRGLEFSLSTILSEQTERSEQSPLILYDAWERYLQGDLAGARDPLKTPPTSKGL